MAFILFLAGVAATKGACAVFSRRSGKPGDILFRRHLGAFLRPCAYLSATAFKGLAQIS
jgi:hypothetical protein